MRKHWSTEGDRIMQCWHKWSFVLAGELGSTCWGTDIMSHLVRRAHVFKIASEILVAKDVYSLKTIYLSPWHVLVLSLQIWHILYTHTFLEGPRIFLRKKILQWKSCSTTRCSAFSTVIEDTQKAKREGVGTWKYEVHDSHRYCILAQVGGKEYPASHKMTIVYRTSLF